MKAIVQRRYGDADELRMEEVDTPEIAADEVLVRVRAAGIDRGTWHLMAGLPYLVRLGFGLRRPRNPVPGLDVAGTVVAVGDTVTRFEAGDEVFGIAKGSFAEYAPAKEAKLAARPSALPAEQAAVMAVSGITAVQAVRDRGRVARGDRVLVIGASGGVGSYAIQVAKAVGAEVTGVASTGKLDLVRALGADDVIDYTVEDFADGTTRYDVIIDVGGNSSLSRLRSALTPKGALVIVGGEEGGRWFGGIGRQLRAVTLSPFVSQRLTFFVAGERGSDMEYLAELFESGRLTPTLDRTYPLDEAADAVRRLEAGEARGKLALVVD